MKKIPLSLSILSVILGLVTGVTDVGAIANTEGPWSFDELLSARNELKAEVDANCPRSSYRLICVDEIKAEKGGVLEHGIMQTEHMQFLPVSIDFSQDVLEYYYSSDSLSRNFDWHLPYKNILPTKLVLIQTNAEYVRNSAEWTDLIMLSDNNPNWITLYSGEVAENEDGFLSINQRANLEIAHLSFEPNYEKAIRGFIEYNTGEYAHFVFTFDNVTDGKKYGAWFGRESNYPFFEDPSYNAGYQDGLIDGNEEGYNEGYTIGYSEGQTDGFNNGYSDGYGAGYNDGINQGHEEGFIEGTDTAYRDGYNEGYLDGYRDGQNEFMNQGDEPDQGNNDDEINSNDNTSSADNQNSDSAPNMTENTWSQSTINTITMTSNLDTRHQTSSTSIKKPNTGASTAESGSIEFQWWLGAVLATGLGALIWLFWPTRQKKIKK